MLDSYDHAAIRRGFQVYQQVGTRPARAGGTSATCLEGSHVCGRQLDQRNASNNAHDG